MILMRELIEKAKEIWGDLDAYDKVMTAITFPSLIIVAGLLVYKRKGKK